MAPHPAHSFTFEHQRLSDKEKLKLRKPIVEKMRRDRINNCIDQLKKLLEKELRNQDPSTKLEKADILEMTVSYLREQQRIPAAAAQRDYQEGYSHCWRESLQFLNVHSNREQSAQKFQQIHQVHRVSSTVSCNQTATNSKHRHVAPEQDSRSVWRPW